MMDFSTLIEPMTTEEFVSEYKGKKYCVVKGNRYRKFMFSNVLTWRRFSEYINNDRAVSGIQAILSNGKKLCMEKNNLHRDTIPSWSRKDYFEKKFLHEIWRNNGSIILTKASLLTNGISNIAGAIEKEFGGACDAHFYCSKSADSRSFDPHIDHDDNFLIHCNGTVRWTICNDLENNKNSASAFDLTVGDMLYIPKGLAHSAVPRSKRISISVPLLEVKDYKTGTLKTIDRKFYDFS